MSQPDRSVSLVPKKGSGKLWDDLGSTTFVTTENNKSDSEKTRPSTHDAKRRALRKRIVESSDDELDFLSSSSRSDDVEQLVPTKSKPREKKKHPAKITIQGEDVDYHPDYLPKRKLPDFKKITNTATPEGGSSTSQSKTPIARQQPLNPTKSYGTLATLHDNENKRLSAPSDGLSSDNGSLVDHTHPLTHVPSQREVQKFPGRALSPLGSCDRDSPPADTPRGSKKTATSHRQSKPLRNKTSLPSSLRIQSSDSSDSSEATPRAKPFKNRLRKFPTLGPQSISGSLVPESDGGKGKAPCKDVIAPVSAQIHRKTLSDMMTPRANRKSHSSSLSSPGHPQSKDSATAHREMSSRGTLDIADNEDADDESPKRRPQLRPFPMAASQLSETYRSPQREITSTSHLCPDNGRSNTFADDWDVFGDDSLYIGEPADPSSLCPFCDEELPPNPSPFYRSLLEAARRKAYLDPRPTNPRGLKAQMGVYVASCKRHRFEAYQIPEAIAKGWPTDINFGRVRRRVESLGGALAQLVRDEGNAREESIYWTTVMKEVRKLGSRAASGVRGQFENFEKTQPGYYGELGSMILHQTLYNMFPPSSFDPQSITPLTPQDFIQRILVPEAALILIMEDTGQDRGKAVQTMRESAGYGVAMFPDISESLEVGAGEDIVLERARARRLELEDEERVEALLRSENPEGENHIQTKGTKRSKTVSSSTTTTTDIEETALARRRMKRKKARSRTDAESGPDGPDFGATRTYRHTAAASSDTALGPSSTPPSPDPSPNRHSPRTSSPEPTQTRTPRPGRRALRAKPKSTPSDPYDSSRRSFANTAVEPVAPSTTSKPQKGSEGFSMHAAIDVNDSRIRHRDPPKSMPRPRIRMVERKASVDRSLVPSDPISRSTNQNQSRDSDSSVEIIEPPPNRAQQDTASSVMTLRDSDAQGQFTNIKKSSSLSSKHEHERHDWLMNDSD